MKIPFYIPFAGIIASFALFIIHLYMPDMALLIAAVILLHLSGWIIAAKFFLCSVGFLSSVLNK